MYSIEEIVKRYNDSVMEYAAYKVAVNEHDTAGQALHLRNVGEGLSQTLEHALKLHAQTHDPALFARDTSASTPKMINTFYLDNSGTEKGLYHTTVDAGVRPTVDFAYIKTHKSDLTNASKHEGGVVRPEVCEEYIHQCKRFITEYLSKDAPLRDIACFMEAQQDPIQQFYLACDHFQREDRTYILLSDKVDGLDAHGYSHFSKAPWDVIIDFHSLSVDAGLSYL